MVASEATKAELSDAMDNMLEEVDKNKFHIEKEVLNLMWTLGFRP